MSTTFTLDTATDRAHPTPRVMRRLTPPAIRARKKDELRWNYGDGITVTVY